MAPYDSPRNRQPPPTDSKIISRTRPMYSQVKRDLEDEILVGGERDGVPLSRPRSPTESQRPASVEVASEPHTDEPSPLCKTIMKFANQHLGTASASRGSQSPIVSDTLMEVGNHLDNRIKDFGRFGDDIRFLADMVSERTLYIEECIKEGDRVHAQS
ncbi:Nn.00g030880.m01.CDS01 [Neocucurbitaria sp. VM-36]